MGEESKPVDVLLQSDDTEEWPMTVAVERDTDGEIFRTEETIPADDGEDLGEVLIEDAFEGTSDDQFTVRAWLEGEPAGTFEYEITCDDDNRFSLLVEHRPYNPATGNRSITFLTGVGNNPSVPNVTFTTCTDRSHPA